MRFEAEVQELKIKSSDDELGITHITIDESEINTQEGYSVLGLRLSNGLLQDVIISNVDLFRLTDVIQDIFSREEEKVETGN